MSSCAAPTAVPHLPRAHHPISESFCGKYLNVIHHAMLPRVCFSLHLRAYLRYQSPGCVGCVGCAGCIGSAGMSVLGGQARWLVDAHRYLMSVWKQHSLDPKTGSEDSSDSLHIAQASSSAMKTLLINLKRHVAP